MIAKKNLRLKKHRHFFETLKNVFWEGITLGTQLISSFLTIRIITKNLGIANFGIYSFWIALISYMNIIIDLGFNITGVREIGKLLKSKEQKSIASFFFNSFILRICMASILATFFLFLKTTHQLKGPAMLVLFLGLIYAIFESTWYLQGFNEYKTRSILATLTQLAILIIVWINRHSIWNILILRTTILMLRELLAFFYTVIKFKLRPQLKISLIIQVLKQTFVNHLTLILSIGYKRAYPLLLKPILNDYAYGVLSAIYKIINITLTVQAAFTKPFFSFIVKLKNNIKKKSYILISTLITLISSLSVTFLLFFTPIFPYIFSGLSRNSALVLNYFYGGLIIVSGLILSGHLNMLIILEKRQDSPLLKIMFLKVIVALVGMYWAIYKLHLIYSIYLFAPLWFAESINLFYILMSFKKYYA